MNHKKTRIIALPFAGGNKYSYRTFEELIPNTYKWETIELPGRGSRIKEAPLTTINEQADDVFRQLKDNIEDSEYIIYGHSMGTLMGYELTKRLIQGGYKLPVCLFFTGRGAPSVEREKKISRYDKDAFWQELREMGGLPKDLLTHEELMDFFEPIIRADLRAVEDYQYQSMEKPFPIPIFVRTGDREPISEEKAQAWQAESSIPIQRRTMPGNHFFIFDHAPYIVKQLVEAHRSVLG